MEIGPTAHTPMTATPQQTEATEGPARTMTALLQLQAASSSQWLRYSMAAALTKARHDTKMALIRAIRP